MRISGFKPFIIFFILVLIVAGGVVWYFVHPRAPERSSQVVTPRPDVSFSVFTLQGKVITVGTDRIIFDTLIPYQTKDGIVMQHTVKAALVDACTQFISSTGTKTTIKAVKVGSDITVYYQASPLEVSAQTATKILLK